MVWLSSHRKECPASQALTAHHLPSSASNSSCHRYENSVCAHHPPSTTHSPTAAETNTCKHLNFFILPQLRYFYPNHIHFHFKAHSLNAIYYLSAQKVLNGTLSLQVPQHHKATTIADQHLVWVQGFLVQGLHTLQVSPGNILLWDSNRISGRLPEVCIKQISINMRPKNRNQHFCYCKIRNK